MGLESAVKRFPQDERGNVRKCFQTRSKLMVKKTLLFTEIHVRFISGGEILLFA